MAHGLPHVGRESRLCASQKNRSLDFRLGSFFTLKIHEARACRGSAAHPTTVISVARRHSHLVPLAGVSRCSKWQLLDHLVGEHEQSWRNVDVERLRGLQVDDEFKFACYDGQIGRSLALEDVAGIDAELAIFVNP